MSANLVKKRDDRSSKNTRTTRALPCSARDLPIILPLPDTPHRSIGTPGFLMSDKARIR